MLLCFPFSSKSVKSMCNLLRLKSTLNYIINCINDNSNNINNNNNDNDNIDNNYNYYDNKAVRMNKLASTKQFVFLYVYWIKRRSM